MIAERPEGGMRAAIGLALLLSLTAAAAGADPRFVSLLGRIVQSRCHMDMCTWFSIEASATSGESRHGTLLHLTVKDWSSTHPGADYSRLTDRKLVATTDQFAFCSKTKPAVIYMTPDQPGSWSAYRLYPDWTDRIFGYNEGVYVLYWAACHDIALTDVYEGGSRLAATLGYRTVPAASDAEVKLASPEAVLLW